MASFGGAFRENFEPIDRGAIAACATTTVTGWVLFEYRDNKGASIAVHSSDGLPAGVIACIRGALPPQLPDVHGRATVVVVLR